jgi:hypothetical protein
VPPFRLADGKEDALSDKMLASVDNLCLRVCDFLFQEKTFSGARREWSLKGSSARTHARTHMWECVMTVYHHPALEFAEKSSTMRMKKLSYHIYRFLLSEISFLDHVAEDVTKLSRHFVGALKFWEVDKEGAKHITLELTQTIHVRAL